MLCAPSRIAKIRCADRTAAARSPSGRGPICSRGIRHCRCFAQARDRRLPQSRSRPRPLRDTLAALRAAAPRWVRLCPNRENSSAGPIASISFWRARQGTPHPDAHYGAQDRAAYARRSAATFAQACGWLSRTRAHESDAIETREAPTTRGCFASTQGQRLATHASEGLFSSNLDSRSSAKSLQRRTRARTCPAPTMAPMELRKRRSMSFRMVSNTSKYAK